MNIPSTIIWEIVLVILGFVFGTLWGHHEKINKRVTYHQCQNNREKCPCITEINNIRSNIKELHPAKKK